MFKAFLKYTLLLLGLANMSSCIPHQKVLILDEGPEFPVNAVAIGDIPSLQIQVDDILDITIRTPDMKAAAPYNLSIIVFDESINNGGNIGFTDYLVDNEGFIDFPGLGRIKVEGLTLKELQLQLQTRLSPFLVDPTIIIRFSNFKFTILGAVENPATYSIQENRITILEAIGYAGDFGILANQENILVLREQNGKRLYGRINLKDRSAFQSPYFYLRQNDVIYIEPRPEKTRSQRDQLTRILPWVSVAASLATLLVAITN